MESSITQTIPSVLTITLESKLIHLFTKHKRSFWLFLSSLVSSFFVQCVSDIRMYFNTATCSTHTELFCVMLFSSIHTLHLNDMLNFQVGTLFFAMWIRWDWLKIFNYISKNQVLGYLEIIEECWLFRIWTWIDLAGCFWNRKK